MPQYEYHCEDCGRTVRLFFSYEEYGVVEPVCPRCNGRRLHRRIGRIALGKSEDARLDAFSDDAALANLDENDPRSIGRFMRKMSSEMGEDLGDDFNEVVNRLEKGESPESIEKSMPELGTADSDVV